MTSLTRRTSQRTAAGLLLLSVLPAANADCFFDDRGRRICNGLSVGARAGIGFGVIALIALILFALALSRRRRIQRANQAYIANPNTYQPYPAPGYNYNQGSYNPTNMPQEPQYPPQTHASYEPYNGVPAYNAQSYSHPGSPPQYPSYAPPSGPPPMQKE